MHVVNLRISQKLPLLIIGASLILGLTLGYVGYHQGSTAIYQEVERKLEITLHARQAELHDYLTAIQEDLTVTAANPTVIEALNDFTAQWNELGENPKAYLQKAYITDNSFPAGEKEKLDFADDGSGYSKSHKEYHPWFRKALNVHHYYDIFLFDTEGNLVYSVFKELDYATNLQSGQWKDSGLGDVFRKSISNPTPDHTAFIDFKPYGPSADAPASFIGKPVFRDGQMIGVLAFQMPIGKINSLMQDATGLGETGESFIVGDDFLMRSDSRFSEQSTILKREVKIEAVKEALAGKSGSMLSTDYRGEAVKAVYNHFDFFGTTWAIVTEIEEHEYEAPIIDMRNSMALIGTILLLLIGSVGSYFARNIAKGLVSITESAQHLANGSHNIDIPLQDRSDEIGEIAKAVQVFKDNAIEMSKLEQERLEQERVNEERIEVERAATEEQLKIASENLRIKVALDNCAANVMVADVDSNIVYLNKAVQELMQSSEADIRKDLPAFSAATLLGSSFDTFHKNPAHNRRLIDQIKSPHETRISIGGKTFDLIASPVIDDDGTVLGTTLEWDEITQELAVQEEIDAVVTAVVSGDFTKSIPIEGKEGFMRNLAEAMNQLNKTVSSVIEDVAAALSALSKGDLTHTIATNYEGTYETLKQDSNQTSAKLKEIVSKIISSSDEIGGAADEIYSGSSDLSNRTETQAANLEETAASMEELATTVKQNADNAKHANDLAIEARNVAEDGGEVVKKAIIAMSEIEESSKKVSEIIGVIDQIAFQTNLLALNAAVEAARAGDAGRGFAVVAAEVGTLAQRTAEAAKDVKNLILNSDAQIHGGVELTNNTGESLHEIVESIKKVADIIGDITVASTEQSNGIEETNTAIAGMDEMTQQNAALVQQSSTAARSLQTQSQSMDDLISFFKLETDQQAVKKQQNGSHEISGVNIGPVNGNRGQGAIKNGELQEYGDVNGLYKH